MSTIDLGPMRDRRPLAVQVYDRLHDALVSPDRVGLEVPTEIELSERLGVSRTTVRQALALLEEDGVLERGPGRRRIVAHPQGPSVDNPPLEEMLAGAGELRVEPVIRRSTPATRWSSSLLSVDHGATLVAWESQLLLDGKTVANALELAIPAHADRLPADAESTMLAVLGTAFRNRAEVTSRRVSLHTADTRAQEPGGLPSDGGAIAFTQVLSIHGRPAYLAKHVVNLRKVSIAL